jgi:hypothetical protein
MIYQNVCQQSILLPFNRIRSVTESQTISYHICETTTCRAVHFDGMPILTWTSK